MAEQLTNSRRDVLPDRQLSDYEVRKALDSIGFADRRAAERCLQHLSYDNQMKNGWQRYLRVLLSALSGAADPDQALCGFERFAHAIDDSQAFVEYLGDNPRAVEVLLTLFGGSRFLSEILLRRPGFIESLMDFRQLAQSKTLAQLETEARGAIAPLPSAEGQLDALRRFQHGEMLRIGTCDLLGLLNMPAVTAQLSRLADSMVRVCLRIAARQSNTAPDGFVVLAMGKLGGGELNYSSDIDLLFLTEHNAMSYLRLGERLIEALSRVTAEGFLYRVDMRLRPWGRGGALVNSNEAHIRYLEQHARQWERQALLKARPVAGDLVVGQGFLRQVDTILFGWDGERIRSDVHGMKQQTEEYLRQAGREWGEVKLGAGSIRDIEFVAQYLQLVHGAKHPEVRSRNTLDALDRLFTGNFLTTEDFRVCVEGYTFLRTIEHYLQITDYQQTYTLPNDTVGLTRLAHRLGFQDGDQSSQGDRLPEITKVAPLTGSPSQSAAQQFVARYQQHSAAIRSVYRYYLESSEMERTCSSESETKSSPLPLSGADNDLHLQRMGNSYLESFSEEDIKRHAEMAKWLDYDNIVEVEALPRSEGQWQVTIVAYDYLGELSLICGLLFAYGFDVIDGDVFTYEPLPQSPPETTPRGPHRGRRRRRPVTSDPNADARQKIVDVFTLKSVLGDVAEDLWVRYAEDLTGLLRRLQDGQQREAQGDLAHRVAVTLHNITDTARTLYPVAVEIDNEASEQYTVLRIDTQDTIGFLYELTNALALHGTYIARMTIGSIGTRVRDTLWVTNAHGQKIISPAKQRELRTATVLVKHFTHLLPKSPNPEAALLHFGEFLGHLFTQPEWPDELASLERPEVLNALARLLGVSEFLWDDFLRMQYENLFPIVRDVDLLGQSKSREQLRRDLASALTEVADGEQRRETINAFKDREMFRIDMRNIQGHVQRFGQFSAELTDLTEIVMDTACQMLDEELRTQYGTPRLEEGAVSPFSLCALGKCGGREMGFASDVELMFIYAGNGQTDGPERTSTSEFYERFAEQLVSAIQARREGIFHIDMQLRPYGKAGSLAVALDAFHRYFTPDGPAWAYER
ncbi:MAG: glutamine synthetase adenylyltransferase, partial [Anaerolineae bacterium]|nr:glutamine synthetase adenylyltransferase [Anaerolineae bacterium]